jgi:RNA polymerase sigma factor (sigma-70 family)
VTVVPFDEIVTEHGPVVMRVCRALLGPADADDAWSETFLAALRAYPALREGSDVRAWLVTIAHRKAIDQLRRASRAPVPTDAALDRAGADTIPEPADDALQDALAQLPPKQRAAVVYRYLADLAYSEVGALLESNEAAARRSAADGIASLRKHFTRGAPR